MRSKNLVILAVSFVILISMISAVSAEIIISQPKALYSLGDEMNVEIKLDAIKTGYLSVDIVCPNGQTNVYNNAPESKTISFKRTLTPDFIENLYGTCHLSASYNKEIKTGQSFELSNSIDITLIIEKFNVDAGGNIIVKGTAYKRNNQLAGQIYHSFVEASLESASLENVSASGILKDGQFELSLYIPETSHAGAKALKVKVYDKDDSGNILNSGEAVGEVTIIQHPAKIGIAIDKLIAEPGENITIIPFVYDKAGDSMADSVKVIIKDSDNKTTYETTATGGSEFALSIPTGNLPGYSTVIAEKEGIMGEKSFEVKELRKISAEVSGNILIIKNAGNVPYSGNVEIKIGDKTFTEKVNLDYGEEARFELSAPDGSYDVLVKDSSSSSAVMNQAGVALTGNAINMRQVGMKLEDVFSSYPMVWIFVVLVIALFIWVCYHRYQKEKRLPKIFGMFRKNRNNFIEIRRGGVEVIKPQVVQEKIEESLFESGSIKRAEQVLVLQGQKQPAGVIAIRLKSQIAGISKESLSRALNTVYKMKGAVQQTGDFIIIIFSPLITKTFKNNETAIKAAIEIDEALKEHNRKFRKDIIEYGIGVNTGEIINKVEERTLKFTNVGKTINIAKRIAEISSQEVILSKEMHEKTLSSIKTEKVAAGSMDLFTVKNVVDKDSSAKFIKEFLKRNS